MLTGAVATFLARVAGLFGLKISGFAAGAIVAGLIAAALGASGFKLYEMGRSAAEAECQTAALQSQIDAANADKENAQKAAAEAKLKAAGLESRAADEKERTADYVKELEQRAAKAEADAAAAHLPPPVNGDALTCDDLRGMRAHLPAVCGPVPRPARASRLHVPRLGPFFKAKR
ncbi:hypothetical protein HU675_0038110 [Bradyrhizobium septentrionale]|uniref:hypothetical protein n=1 Tax=Bradyrhizobium septentrionale TaxID=1404411 RepID=UPI0015964568|nr:hypothetical protein [Bradyrhizobium septentrionale]UGY23701.1 hypothetical protein HU675_0038110 [Bradyrhizobium septentrionale]